MALINFILRPDDYLCPVALCGVVIDVGICPCPCFSIDVLDHPLLDQASGFKRFGGFLALLLLGRQPKLSSKTQPSEHELCILMILRYWVFRAVSSRDAARPVDETIFELVDRLRC